MHTDWTHAGGNKYRNSNIDVILFRNFDDGEPEIEFLDHNSRLSDHIPIIVTIKNLKNFRLENNNKMYYDQQDMYEHQIALLQNIVDSIDVEYLIKIFETFANK